MTDGSAAHMKPWPEGTSADDAERMRWHQLCAEAGLTEYVGRLHKAAQARKFTLMRMLTFEDLASIREAECPKGADDGTA